jgi:hypothetical protein
MKDIELCGVTIHIPDSPVALNVSGGADSALLLYILMKHSNYHVTALTSGINDLGMSNTVAASHVVNKVIELTDNYNIDHIIRYKRDFVGDDLANYDLVDNTLYYYGQTSNPPHDDMLLFNDIECSMSDRTSDVIRDTWFRDNKIHVPFNNVDKKKVAEIYDHLGITESVFPLTVSCTKNDDGTHCDDCWWCSERKWAFGKLV